MTTTDVRPPRFGLLREHDFRMLWIGESASSLGSSVTSVALPLVAVTLLDASAFAVSVLAAAAWLPWLLIGLPAGAWVDRLPRRRVMLTADWVSMAAFLSVPAAALLGVLTVAQLVVVALAAGTAKVFFATAYRAYLPSLVRGPDLLEANVKLQGSEQVANLAGPGIAGLLAQLFSAVGALLVDAASFAVSALCLMRVKHTETIEPRPRRRLRAEIRDGLRTVTGDPLLRGNMLYGCSANLALTGYQSLLVLFLVGDLGLAPGTTGLLIAATSVGGVIGAFAARPLAARLGTARAVLLGRTCLAPAGLLIACADQGLGLALYVTGSIVIVGGVVVANVIFSGFVQSYVPSALMGRVTTCVQVVNFGAIPLGALLAGALATAFTVRTALWVMLGLFALSGLILLATPIRRLRDLPTHRMTDRSLAPATVP
ncbi:MFS transporter [Nonomuraea sp. SBT364]|uniref:MFS transporter n=1 Tax=Nonomuraea sp. SBT364 TaxID=1580530 RepID=UPI00066D39CA|nr:MFS transporter [Nonomuraea sp. SBT364]